MRHDSAKRHIFFGGGLRTQVGGYDPPIWTRPRFLAQRTYPQVSSSYIHSFGSYHVETQTHKHTDPQTNRRRGKHPTFFATLRRWV